MIKINLIPPELRKKKKIPFIDRTFFYGLFILIGEIILLYFVSLNQSAKIAELDAQIAETQQALVKYKDQIALVEKAKQVRENLIERLNALQELEYRRPTWVRILSEFSGLVPDYVWISKFEYQSGTTFLCEGDGYSLRSIASFLLNLLSSKCFSNVRLGKITQRDIEGGAAYSFSLTMNVAADTVSSGAGQFVVNEKALTEKKKEGSGFVESVRSKVGLISEHEAKIMFGGGM